MSIPFSSNSIHQPDLFMFGRDYWGKEESQNVDPKAFKRDTLEVSQLSQNREAFLDRMKHTIADAVTSFSSTVAGILKDVREEKGQYGYSNVVNACGLSYAGLAGNIKPDEEKRTEKNDEEVSVVMAIERAVWNEGSHVGSV